MRTGLFGGTFDPIHIGHLFMAETVCSDFPLDRIVFIPAAQPPHKNVDVLTAAVHRMKMVQLAVQGNDRFEVSDYEINKGAVSYTIETVRWFQNSKEFGSDELFLLMGADSLLEIGTWKNPDELFRTIPVIVFGRSHSNIQEVDARFKDQFQLIKLPLCDISSTEIRKRVRKGLSIKFWAPNSVASYIQQERLYQSS